MQLANLGSTDRIIRLIAGAILLALPFIMDMNMGGYAAIAMLVVGAVLVVTSVIKFCPAYKVIGVRTNANS